MSVSRRQFIKNAALGSAALGLARFGCSRPKQPNIIFIMADDLGYGDLGCYGQTNFSTPNIDQLAQQGMRFTQHYAGSTVCAPSRCVLMTGRHTGHAVVRGNRQAEPRGQMPLPADETTVAAALKQAGYATGCFGKWGLGLADTPGDPQKHGFDTFCGYYDQVRAHNAFPAFIYKNAGKIHLDNEVVYMPKDHWSKGLGSYSTEKNEYARHVVADEALKFIEQHQNRPFFLYFPTTIPHDNGEAAEGAKNEVPEIHPDYRDKPWSHEQKQYATVIRILDDYVGRILTKLKELGLEKNTLMVFTSDNGAMPAPWCQTFRSNGPLRGAKRDLYEGVSVFRSLPGGRDRCSRAA
ncbi:MAG: sulfatase-like hydrolase/transferase [candidate division KSB1 bacterium]|nr:sulfatase-like hydrolase/transferase [candidate division KSB1 bacterium]